MRQGAGGRGGGGGGGREGRWKIAKEAGRRVGQCKHREEGE